MHPVTLTKTEGDDLTLSCNATGNPEPTVLWTRNGSPINTTGNSRVNFSSNKKQLAITNVSRTDSGKYRCVASNKLGNDTSSAATLDVQCKLTTDHISKGNNIKTVTMFVVKVIPFTFSLWRSVQNVSLFNATCTPEKRNHKCTDNESCHDTCDCS